MRRASRHKRRWLRDLGGGLILRRATRRDAGALAAFNSDVLCEPGSDDRPEEMAAWTRDLMSGDHPTFKPSDFTVVEDTNTGAIASAMCLIPQTWSYEGVRLGVGLPELVGTKPEYRRRGLVRAQFDLIHEWSARRNHSLQAIGGIPNFYRQFGYEMALEHRADVQSRHGALSGVVRADPRGVALRAERAEQKGDPTPRAASDRERPWGAARLPGALGDAIGRQYRRVRLRVEGWRELAGRHAERAALPGSRRQERVDSG